MHATRGNNELDLIVFESNTMSRGDVPEKKLREKVLVQTYSSLVGIDVWDGFSEFWTYF